MGMKVLMQSKTGLYVFFGLLLSCLGGVFLLSTLHEMPTYHLQFGCLDITKHVRELWIDESTVAKTHFIKWVDENNISRSEISHREVTFIESKNRSS
jgi:hypothetical protein